jgi:two-component system, NarL family, response regulator NreC
MSKINILLADDHTILRSGLKALINSRDDMQVIGEASTHHQAYELSLKLHPDILCLDLSMPDGRGLKVIQDLALELPQLRVLVLTMHDESTYFRMAMAAGACGYLVKNVADTELLDAIQCIAQGKIYAKFDTAQGHEQILAKGDKNSAQLSKYHLLSDREKQVLIELARGHTNTEIAAQIQVSVKTIESYRARLMVKLDLHNRAELTKFALESNLLK